MKRRGLAPSKSRGFTLIELLVVIAIIGILATVILINLTGGRKAAQATALLSYLKTVQTSAAQCIDGGGKVQEPTNSKSGGANYCDNSALVSGQWISINPRYPNWEYLKAGTTSRPAGMNAFASTASSFNFGAYKTDLATTPTNNNWYIQCTPSNCSKSGF